MSRALLARLAKLEAMRSPPQLQARVHFVFGEDEAEFVQGRRERIKSGEASEEDQFIWIRPVSARAGRPMLPADARA